MTPTLLRVAAISLVSVLVQQPSAPPQSGDDVWPPTAVARAKDPGVVLPRLLYQARPKYTSNAMREKIEGKVVLECIVEIDGSVQRVHVTRSLDAVYGLDDEAVAAAKQWRFTAGTKDHVAIPVLITIELAFTLRSPAPAAMAWPEAFAPAGNAATDASGWAEDVEEASGLRIRVLYPSGWRVRKGEPPTRLVTLTNASGGTRSLFVENPRPARFEVGQGVSAAALQRLAATAGQNMSGPAGAPTVIGAGQTRASDRVWVWTELQLPTFDPQHFPDGLGAFAVSLFDTARIWTFLTTVGSQEILVGCVALHRTGMAEADTQRDLQDAGTEFAAMLTRISIQPH